MCFTESNLKNPELSNKVCRETKRLNRSINLIGLIESKRDAAGITSKGFSVCSLRSDQTPTALRYSGFSSLEYCFSEIKKAISTIASYSVAKNVTLQGFEPRTSWSVVRCSIQLSYSAFGLAKIPSLFEKVCLWSVFLKNCFCLVIRLLLYCLCTLDCRPFLNFFNFMAVNGY